MITASSLKTVNRKSLLVFILILICTALSCAKKESGPEHVFKGSLKQTLTGHDESVRSVAFSGDGKTVASGGLGNAVKLWDAQTGSLKRSLEDTGPPVAFSPNGQTLATVDGFKNTIRLWDASTGAEKQTLSGHSGEITSVAFSPDGQTVASGIPPHMMKSTNTLPSSQALTPKCAKPTTTGSSRDQTIIMWDAQTGALKQTIKTDDIVLAVAFSPRGDMLASTSGDKTVKLWDAQNSTSKKTLTGEDNMTSVSFSPDGKLLAGGSYDKTVRVWDVQTAELKFTLKGHDDVVESVAFSPDGTLASASADKTVKLWE